MIDTSWSPYLSVGGVSVAWHGVFGVVGIIAGVALGVRMASPRVPVDAGYGIALWSVVGGLIGSRLVHVLSDYATYLADPLRSLAVWDGGEAVIGGIVGGIGTGAFIVMRDRLPLGFTVDRGTIGLPLGMAIGRIGDVINGEHWATACAGVPWCVGYTAPDTLGQRGPVHPAVAYELVLDLAILALMLALAPRAATQRRQGQLMLLFLGAYGGGRLALSRYRLDPPWLGGLTEAQALSIVFVIVSAAGIAWLRRPTASPRSGRS